MSPIADMLTIIKNAQGAHHDSVMLPFSTLKFNIANVLLKYGFIAEVEKKKKKIGRSEKDHLFIKLKYNDNNGVIRGIKLISTPSRRMYAHKDELHSIMSGQGISVLSTSRGIMSGAQAKKANVGGELIFQIW